MTDFFAAIDFETANGQRSSVCSVGIPFGVQPFRMALSSTFPFGKEVRRI